MLETPSVTISLELVTSIYLLLSDAHDPDYGFEEQAEALRSELHTLLSNYKAI